MSPVQHLSLAYYSSGMPLKEYSILQERAYPGLVTGGLINEGVKEILKDALQTAAGAGAVFATGGMGGDTAVDVCFAVEASSTAVTTIDGLISQGGHAGDIYKDLSQIDLSIGPDGIYHHVQSMVGTIGQSAGSGAAEGIFEKIKDSIFKTLTSLTDALSDWVATLIPDDAGLAGTAIRESIMAALKIASGSVWDVLKKALLALPVAAQAIMFKAGALENFLTTTLNDIIAYLDSKGKESFIGKQADNLGQAAKDVVMSINPITKIKGIFNYAKDTAGNIASEIPQVKSFLENTVRPKIPEAVALFKKIFGLQLGGIALLQIIVNGDWGGAKNIAQPKFAPMPAATPAMTQTQQPAAVMTESRFIKLAGLEYEDN